MPDQEFSWLIAKPSAAVWVVAPGKSPSRLCPILVVSPDPRVTPARRPTTSSLHPLAGPAAEATMIAYNYHDVFFS